MDFYQALVLELLDSCRRRNLSLGELARSADIPLSTLKNILNGKSHNPGILTLLAICDGLEIPLPIFLANVQQRTTNTIQTNTQLEDEQ